jgi:hypothetical protein
VTKIGGIGGIRGIGVTKSKIFPYFCCPFTKQQGWCPADEYEKNFIKDKNKNNAREKTYIPTS